MNWYRSATSYVLRVRIDHDTIQVAGMSSWAPKLGSLIISNKIGEVVSTIPSQYLVVWLVRIVDVFGLEAIGFNVETVEVRRSSGIRLLILICTSTRILSSKYGILEDSRASGENTFCIWIRYMS